MEGKRRPKLIKNLIFPIVLLLIVGTAEIVFASYVLISGTIWYWIGPILVTGTLFTIGLIAHTTVRAMRILRD